MKEEELIERMAHAETILSLSTDSVCSLANSGHMAVHPDTGEDELKTLHEMLHDFGTKYKLPIETQERRQARVVEFKRKGHS